jgi:hypothetical protein
VAEERIPRALERAAARCAAELYVLVAAALAIAVLLQLGHGSPTARVAIVMLAPIALYFAAIMPRSFFKAAAVWRSQQVQAHLGRSLAALGPEFRVLSRLGISPRRQDHIVVGPSGVFVILSCDQAGRVTASSRRLFVNARPQWRELLDDCRTETMRVRERIRRSLGRPLPVYGVLCFNRALVAVGQEIVGVKILHASRLARTITSTATATPLGQTQVEAAVVALTQGLQLAQPLRGRLTRKSRPAAAGERRLALVGRRTPQLGM